MINHEINNKILTITLNNPKNHNAFSDQLIIQFNKMIKLAENTDDLQTIILKSTGPHFSSGADLQWMQSMANQSKSENKKDALLLAQFLYRFNQLPIPVIALVQGRVFGGALGLLACCDVVIAENNAQFCFSEVKLGLIPATIAPYIVQKIGYSQARRLFITGESFDAETAQTNDLVHHLCEPGTLETNAQSLLQQLQRNGPEAMSAIKSLLNALYPIQHEVIDTTAEALAKTRGSEEAQIRLKDFFEK